MIRRITYTLNKEYYINAQIEELIEVHLKFKNARKYLLLTILFILLYFLVNRNFVYSIILIIAIEIFLSIFITKILKKIFNLFIKNWTDKNLILTINTESEIFDVESNSNQENSKISIYWNVVKGLYITKNNYLIISDVFDDTQVIIPKKIFTSEKEQKDFEKMVKYLLNVYT